MWVFPRRPMTDRNPLIPELPGAQAILVVDDAPVVRRLTYRLLAEAGYRVFEAANATEALEVLGMARGQVKLVLIDVVLGFSTGEIIWWEPITQRYTRLNKHVCHPRCCWAKRH